MCGIHTIDGDPVGHEHHHHTGPVFYPRARHKSRRAFLGDVGKGTMAMAVITPSILAACSSSEPAANVANTAVSGTEPPATVATTVVSGTDADSVVSGTDEGSTDAEAPADEALRWARTNLGFVSAYVLARGNKAAIVDTGTAGSAEAIGESLQSLGLNYNDVEHVILTHNHGDHAGSIDQVLAAAVNATAYAGEADLNALSNDSISGLVGGEEIFGFETVWSPGHTAGHMAVIDHEASLLVAGDAIWTEDGGVALGPERFNTDTPQALESVKTLASLSFNTLLVGHGDPIEMNADTALADLAATL